MLRTVATSSASGTERCASRLLLQMLVAAFFQLGEFGADDQVLDRDFPLGLFVGALDDDARRVALVGVFELVAEVARIAEIKLGADVCCAKLCHHALIVGEPILIEHGDNDWAGLGLVVKLADVLERRGESRHADGKSGGWHRLAAKARDEAVIAAAAADGAEARRAVLTIGRECQLKFEDGAGVIFKTADDGGVDANARLVIARRRRELCNCL